MTAYCPASYRTDAVHLYTNEGRELMGDAVVSFICRELGIEAKDINIKDFHPEKYTVDNIGY